MRPISEGDAHDLQEMLHAKPDAIDIRFRQFRDTIDVIDTVDMLRHLMHYPKISVRTNQVVRGSAGTYPLSSNIPVVILDLVEIDERNRYMPVLHHGGIR